MSAELLREAAALMSERAEGANDRLQDWWPNNALPWATKVTGSRVTGGHIASWHPAVALAVAHLLDTEAAHAERGRTDWNDPDTVARNALAIARAYLGRDA